MKSSRQQGSVRGVLALAALCAAGAASAAEPAPAAPRLANTAEVKRAVHARGRPRLVHAWATWCRPCLAEWPLLAELLREHASGVDVVSVALDEKERLRDAARLLAEAGAPGRALVAPPGEAGEALRALDPAWDGAIPATWLLAPDGALVLAQRGGTNPRALREALDRLTKHGAEGARDVAGERRRP